MKFLRNNLKVIIAFIIGVLIASGITVYATSYFASNVTYKEGKSVEFALNDLYEKTNSAVVTNGTNDKKYKLIDEFKTNTNQGYVPILTSNDSSKMGIAFCSFTPYYSNTGAWTAFNGDDTGSNNRILYTNNENTTWGYVGFKTTGVLFSIKKITARVCTSSKDYNYALQYLDPDTTNWVSVKSGSLTSNNTYDLEGTLENPVYTTSFRIYSDTYKTSGNNLGLISLQAYP